MRLIFLFLVCSGVLYACHAAPGYVIKGNLKNYSGKMFLITSHEKERIDTLAVANIENGKLELRGSLQEPLLAWLQAEKGDLKIPVYLENSSFSLEIDMSKPAEYTLSGGRLQNLFNKFDVEVIDSVRMRREVLKQEYRKAAESDNLFGVMHIRALMANVDSIYESKEDAFLRENNNIVSAGLIRGRLNELLRKKGLRAKFELLGDTARNSVVGRELEYSLSREKSTDIGAIAPDFTMNTPEGNPVSLHSIKAKVKIVDFWASWCGPCRAENPNVRNVYSKYHDSGLEIISVSLDNKKERWLQAIEQDSLPWIHVSDLLGWECAAAKLYGVRGIPFLLVLDEDNRIIGTKLRGEELEACVSKVLSK